MASHSAVFSIGPKTLSTTTVDTCTLTGSDFDLIDVTNVTGSANLTVTVKDGSAPDDPVAGANDNYVVPTGRTRRIKPTGFSGSSSSVVVKVLGNGNVYLVEGVQP
jgi:hypothetical protein